MNDRAALRSILDGANGLLIDFDGPVCSVFAGFPAPVVAEQLREVLKDGGYAGFPPEIDKADDPFDVLNYAWSLGEGEADLVESALTAHEVEAVNTAETTAGSHELIWSWHAAGRNVAVVSNNSTRAVESYVTKHRLPITIFSARDFSNPDYLKPSPYLVNRAARMLDVATSSCVLIGDSLSDIEAAQIAGAMSIGYANKSHKVELFATTKVDAISVDMRNLIK